MPELSPRAEAILNAVTFTRYDAPYFACPKSIDQIRLEAAGVLRAAADGVKHHWDGMECVDYLCSIAAELEGQP
jgi:hypothetical protein